MAQRQADIKATYDQLDADRERMETTRREYEQRLANIEAEAREKIQAAVKEAQSAAGQSGRRCPDSRRRPIIEQGRNESERERQEAFAEMRQQIVTLAVAAAGKVIGENLNDARQTKLVDDFIGSLGTGPVTDAGPARRLMASAVKQWKCGRGMKDIRVAKRYAAALFAVADRNDILDAVAADLELMHRFMTEVPYLRAMLMQPLVSDSARNKCRR